MAVRDENGWYIEGEFSQNSGVYNATGYMRVTGNKLFIFHDYSYSDPSWSVRDRTISNNNVYCVSYVMTYEGEITFQAHNTYYNNLGRYFSYRDSEAVTTTDLPIFTSNEAIEKYLNSGDISDAENYDDLTAPNVESKIYVDESLPPNLKITWNTDATENVPKEYTIEYEIKETSSTGIIPRLKENYPFAQGNVVTTWGKIELLAGADAKSIDITLSYDGKHEVTINVKSDGTFSPSEASNGKHSVNVFSGTGEGDDGYESADEESEATDENTTTSITNLLTSTYKVTNTQLQALNNFLWGDDFSANVKLLNNSPIENIISVKAIPVSISGTASNIILGNVDSKVSGEMLNTNYVKKTIGSVKIPKIYNNFADYEHCKIELYLPLIGIITNLSPTEVCGYTITLKYCFDVITGDCLAMVFNNRGGGENCIGVYKGNCGIDIPLTASNRAQVEAGYISDFVGGVSSLVTGNVAGAVNAGLSAMTRQNVTKTSGSVSGVTAQGLPNKAYIIVEENVTQIPSTYAQTYGRPCNLSLKLGKLAGFTMCDSNVRLNIECSIEEQNMIRQALSEGVIL